MVESLPAPHTLLTGLVMVESAAGTMGGCGLPTGVWVR